MEAGLINKLCGNKGKNDLGQWNWDELSFIIYTQLALGQKKEWLFTDTLLCKEKSDTQREVSNSHIMYSWHWNW